TISLITNPEVLAVNQESTAGHQAYRQGDTIAWTADVPGKSDKYVAVFNAADTTQVVDLKWSDVGVAAASVAVRDLWERKDLGTQSPIHVSLAPHASVLYR